MINIKDVNFITSAADKGGFFLDSRVQVAVAGKSNVGKSSFINMLVNRGNAARVSGTPGRTRLINFFDIRTNGGDFVLTDLPGYGYAKVSKEQKSGWGKLVESYFETVAGVSVFVLVDIRHTPSPDDIKLIEYLYYKTLPFYIIANKADKQSRAQNLKSKKVIADAFKVGEDNVILISSIKKTGRDEVLDIIEKILS
ncbi:MAG: ribosome biogenesis GTP-binding protein YihA/YsxC [Clostridiales bacterium]|jgi:GTP-binding protein|nr:ribosome biogenesis GTP-binding protein YihA/YsxC [Clostridiales bacterium]